jgi:hypothetical protein
MSILREDIKKIPVPEQAIGEILSVTSGKYSIRTLQGKIIQAVNDSNQRLDIGDHVTVILSSTPTIVGRALFKRGSSVKVFV